MLTREQRIACIVRTLRPTDPDSWEPNILYVTAEFDGHDAEQRQTIDAKAQRIRELEQQEKAWHLSFEGLERQHKALTDQIPADMINADPILCERVTTAAAMEEIGRQQITDLQAKVKELEADRDHWKRSAESSLHEFCQLQITYGEQKHKLRHLEAELDKANSQNAHANQQTRQTLFQGIKDRDINIQQLETELAQLKGRVAVDEDSHL